MYIYVIGLFLPNAAIHDTRYLNQMLVTRLKSDGKEKAGNVQNDYIVCVVKPGIRCRVMG